MRDDDISPEEFAPASIVLDRQAAARSSRPARGSKFVKVPISWKDQLTAARCAVTYHVALELLHRSNYVEHARTIRFANVGLTPIGITPRRKWQALAELERLGLVRIDRRPRKSPMVTLLYPGE
jgi:hypothetical protein